MKEQGLTFSARVEARISRILVEDPVCCGRVTTETVERIARMVVAAAKAEPHVD